MKIVICDYPDTLQQRKLDYEVQLLHTALPGSEVCIVPYESQAQLSDTLKNADALLTAFAPVDGALLAHCPNLRCISVNATGFDAIDVEAATAYGVRVCAIREYCTEDVADFTMSLLLALGKKLKAHGRLVEQEKLWQYRAVGPVMRLRGKTLAVFGFGRIGQAVTQRARAFGMRILAVDPYLPLSVVEAHGAEQVNRETACREAHFITNHMMATPQNRGYFDEAFFRMLQNQPIFVNAARAETVDEAALAAALDEGLVSAAGLDVLENMGLDLTENPLVGRDNVIITPHAAFYTTESLKALQDISCQNMIACLQGRAQEAFICLNEKALAERRA